MYDDTVTIFNRRKTDQGTVWYPTVVEDVLFRWERTAATAGYGWKSQDKAVVMIPYTRVAGAMMVAGTIYLPPKLWQSVSEPQCHMTIAEGEEFDFFLWGSWPEEGPVADSQWPGGLYEHLCRERDGVFAVGSVSRYSALPHFEVVGR